MKACPSPEELSRLLDEEQAEAERSPLEEHVEHCPACQKTLERLTADSVLRRKALVEVEGRKPEAEAGPPALAGASGL